MDPNEQSQDASANRHHSCRPSRDAQSGSKDGPKQETRTRASPVVPSRDTKNVKRHHTRKADVILAWKNIFGRSSQSSTSKAKSQRASTRKAKTTSESRSARDSTETEEDQAISTSNADDVGSATPSSSARLGRAELGKFAHEDTMPRSLRKLLKGRGESCNSGIIGVLSKLLQLDPSTKSAVLCDPRVRHVAKMRQEGSFCGYRNLQMIISYIIHANAAGAELFADDYPTIFQLQDLIENAWDHGHNSHGRLETGGIKGTRKFIGTPEAQALFSGLGIRCTSQAFRDQNPGRAATLMLECVSGYFSQGVDKGKEKKVHRTCLAPVYFQHQGHSLTIVGVEIKEDGERGLIVFDPAHRDTSVMRDLVGTSVQRPPSSTSRLLRPYRCSIRYLRKFKEFELLFLDQPPIIS